MQAVRRHVFKAIAARDLDPVLGKGLDRFRKILEELGLARLHPMRHFRAGEAPVLRRDGSQIFHGKVEGN